MLKHEVEKWDETGTSTVWVKLPFLEAATTTQYIWMYYNNSATTTSGAATSSVWDTNFVGVWHLKEDPTSNSCGGLDDICDSTSNSRHGAGTNLEAGDQTFGRINGSIDFDGTNESVVLGNDIFDSLTQGTISAFVRQDAADTSTIIGNDECNDSSGQFQFYISSSGDLSIWATQPSDICSATIDAGFAISTPTNFHHVAFSDNTSGNKFYTDGMQVTPTYTTGSAATDFFFDNVNAAGGYEIGGVPGTDTEDFNGMIDELRVSDVVRSADWIQQEYRYGAASSTTHAFGSEEGQAGGASFLATEDSPLDGAVHTGVTTASTTRLRMLVDESNSIATTSLYQLEYATSTIAGYTGCANLSTWVIVANQASSTSYAWKMSPTARFANGAASTNNSNLTDPTGSFRAGVT